MIFHCPACGTAAGELATTGTQTLFCGACRFKYHVTAGALESRESREITLRPQTPQYAGSHEREYEFRLRQPEGVRVVTLRTRGRDEQFTGARDDVVAIVHAMRGNVVENAVAVINQTTGNEVVIGQPGQTTRTGALLIAAVASFLSFLAAAAAGAPELFALLMPVAVFAFVFFMIQHKLKPTHTLTPGQRSALDRTSLLLREKTQVEQRMADIRNDRREKVEIHGKLLALRAKMEDVGAELYQTRIDRINGALPLLDEKVALNDRLLDAYARRVKMMEIELESQSSADALPEDLAEQFAARQIEIEAIESRTSDVKLLLSANEEVERFVRGG